MTQLERKYKLVKVYWSLYFKILVKTNPEVLATALSFEN